MKYVCADAKNLYLTAAPLGCHEYMRMPIDIFPQEFIDQYDLANKVHNGFLYCAIIRCMYGLPQSGILADKLLRKWCVWVCVCGWVGVFNLSSSAAGPPHYRYIDIRGECSSCA